MMHKDTFRALQGSKRFAFNTLKKAEGGKLGLAYRTWCRKLHVKERPICKSTKRTDVCPICEHWAKIANPKLRAQIDDILSTVSKECPELYKNLPKPKDTRDVEEKDEWASSLVNYLEDHVNQCSDCPSSTSAVVAIGRLQADIIPRLTEIQFHNALRFKLRDQWDNDAKIIGGTTIYMTCDFKAPLIEGERLELCWIEIMVLPPFAVLAGCHKTWSWFAG